MQIRAANNDDKQEMQNKIVDAQLTKKLNDALVANNLPKLAGNPGATFVLCVLWLG